MEHNHLKSADFSDSVNVSNSKSST